MDSPRITYSPRGDTSQDADISTLSNIYSFVLRGTKKDAACMSSTNGTSVRYTEGVGDVERHSD